jgi:hypothetical protein
MLGPLFLECGYTDSEQSESGGTFKNDSKPKIRFYTY